MTTDEDTVARPRPGLNSRYDLRLYVAGNTLQSNRAITNLKAICETHLKDRYILTVVDIYERKQRAREDGVHVSPTLVRRSPLPERRLIGDLSETEKVIMALNLTPALHQE